jgi:hypothetical protein
MKSCDLQREKLAFAQTRDADAEPQRGRVGRRPLTVGNAGNCAIFVLVPHIIKGRTNSEQQDTSIAPAPRLVRDPYSDRQDGPGFWRAPHPAGALKVLFDHNLPHKLRTELGTRCRHEIVTASYMGCRKLKNGELLRAAEENGFDIFVTGDQTLAYEQNLAGRRLAILALSANNWPIIKDYVAEIQQHRRPVRSRRSIAVSFGRKS